MMVQEGSKCLFRRMALVGSVNITLIHFVLGFVLWRQNLR